MANTNVFRGSDATLTLAPSDPNVPEGVEANTVIEEFQLSPVGRASDVEVYVQTDLKAYHEIGKRHPAQLRPGNINVSGKIGRAYINGALLRLLLGKGALVNRENEPYPQPSFNMVLSLTDPATPGTTSVLTVHGVKLENWAYALPEDDFVMESVTFKGLFISVEDTQG
jgi:hypothetical protein